jgi:hypothetical protein
LENSSITGFTWWTYGSTSALSQHAQVSRLSKAGCSSVTTSAHHACGTRHVTVLLPERSSTVGSSGLLREHLLNQHVLVSHASIGSGIHTSAATSVAHCFGTVAIAIAWYAAATEKVAGT